MALELLLGGAGGGREAAGAEGPLDRRQGGGGGGLRFQEAAVVVKGGDGDVEPEVEGEEEAHLQPVHLRRADPAHLGVVRVVEEPADGRMKKTREK